MTSLQYTTAAGSDVNAEVAVGNAIYDMKAKIGSNNRPGAITDYNNGNEVDDVKPLFDGTSDTGTVKAKFVAEYGSDFVDDFLIFVEAADVSDEAKNELIEKTLMDMVIMHLVLDKIDTSTTMRTGTRPRRTTSARAPIRRRMFSPRTIARRSARRRLTSTPWSPRARRASTRRSSQP